MLYLTIPVNLQQNHFLFFNWLVTQALNLETTTNLTFHLEHVRGSGGASSARTCWQPYNKTF